MSGDVIHSGGRRFWPWVEQPSKLWSLLDMLRFSAHSFVRITGDLKSLALMFAYGHETKTLGDGAPSGETLAQMKALLGIMKKECGDLPLSRSFWVQVDDVMQLLEDDMTFIELSRRIETLSRSLYAELSSVSFFYLEPRAAEMFEAAENYFGQSVLDALPSCSYDLQCAARCCALSQPTACVFHLMRAVEVALHEWVKRLGIAAKLPKPVRECTEKLILDHAEKRIAVFEQRLKKTERNARSIQYHREALARFRGIKDAWRNQVAHAKEKYTEEQAEDLLNHVRGFLQALVAKP